MKFEGLTMNQLAERNAFLVQELEKAREVTNCPADVDLQDHLKALVAESLAMKQQEPKAWYIRTSDEVTTDPAEARMWRGIPLVMANIPWRRFDVAPGPLFVVAQPVAVVPDEMAISDDMNLYQKSFAQGHNACRAAMLKHSEVDRDMVEPVSQAYKLPATRFQQVADLYGITSPTGSETSFTFDAFEASSFAKSGWSVQEYVELERYQRAVAGNSPVIPDGWVMVPIEPTGKMIIEGFESEPDEFFSDADVWEAYEAMSGCQQAAHRAELCWAAMIAAAPKPGDSNG